MPSAGLGVRFVGPCGDLADAAGVACMLFTTRLVEWTMPHDWQAHDCLIAKNGSVTLAGAEHIPVPPLSPKQTF